WRCASPVSTWSEAHYQTQRIDVDVGSAGCVRVSYALIALDFPDDPERSDDADRYADAAHAVVPVVVLLGAQRAVPEVALGLPALHAELAEQRDTVQHCRAQNAGDVDRIRLEAEVARCSAHETAALGLAEIDVTGFDCG